MADQQVAANVEGYTRRAGQYDDVHVEIFNQIEQERLRAALVSARDAILSGGPAALDYGCGSGNLTRHLVDLGFDVTAADVTPAFLEMVAERYDVPIIELVDGDTGRVPNESFDLIALYSVLHHIPDYIAAVRDLVQKLRPGGVLFLDHEHNRNHWFPPAELAAFRAQNHEATRTGRLWDPEHKRWQHLLRAATSPSRHVTRYRKSRRMPVEGDIHVYRDDHIEWEVVVQTLEAAGCELVARIDHLHFREGYDRATWEQWKDRTHDMTCLIARRA